MPQVVPQVPQVVLRGVLCSGCAHASGGAFQVVVRCLDSPSALAHVRMLCLDMMLGLAHLSQASHPGVAQLKSARIQGPPALTSAHLRCAGRC